MQHYGYFKHSFLLVLLLTHFHGCYAQVTVQTSPLARVRAKAERFIDVYRPFIFVMGLILAGYYLNRYGFPDEPVSKSKNSGSTDAATHAALQGDGVVR